MTEDEKTLIVQEVLAAIKANSLSLEQLTAVVDLQPESFVEISGGRKMKISMLVSEIAKSINDSNVAPLVEGEAKSRKKADDELAARISSEVSKLESADAEVKSTIATLQNLVNQTSVNVSNNTRDISKIQEDVATTNQELATTKQGLSETNKELGKAKAEISNLSLSIEETIKYAGGSVRILHFHGFVAGVAIEEQGIQSYNSIVYDTEHKVFLASNTVSFTTKYYNAFQESSEYNKNLKPRTDRMYYNDADGLLYLTLICSISSVLY